MMHVALFADTAYLDAELLVLHHLLVGLVDEQVRTVRVLPRGAVTLESGLLGEELTWEESRWSWLNHRRIAALAPRLEALEVNLLHVLDGRLWPAATDLLRELPVPAIFSANAYEDLRFADRVARHLDPSRVAFAGATEPITAALRERIGGDYTFATLAPGALAENQARQRQPNDAVCVAVSGDGRLDQDYQALLQAMAALLRDEPQMQFFFDGQSSSQHLIWQEASRLGLLGNISMLPQRLSHRELLLRADVLVHPQALGRCRGLTLEAMAHGLPVIAQDDPWLDYLIDETTAWVLNQPGPDEWQLHLMRVLTEPAACQQLGQRARAWVREHRGGSAQVAAALNLYRGLTGETIKFPGAV